MDHIDEPVRGRRSVRPFDERAISPQDVEKLCAFMAKIDNPYDLPAKFKLLDAEA